MTSILLSLRKSARKITSPGQRFKSNAGMTAPTGHFKVSLGHKGNLCADFAFLSCCLRRVGGKSATISGAWPMRRGADFSPLLLRRSGAKCRAQLFRQETRRRMTMKPIVVALGVGALALGGYVYVSSQQADDITAAPEQVNEAPAEIVAQEPLATDDTTITQELEQTLNNAADAAADAGAEVQEQAEALADNVADAVNDAVAGAVSSANDAAAAVAESVENTASGIAEGVSNSANLAETTLSDQAEAAQDSANALSEELAEGASDAANAATAEAGAAVDAGAGAVAEGIEAAGEAVTGAADTAADALSEGAETASDAASAAAADTPVAELSDADKKTLLSPEGFDYDKVAEMIDASALDAGQKALLTTTLDQVRNNPALLEQTLTRIQEALGLK